MRKALLLSSLFAALGLAACDSSTGSSSSGGSIDASLVGIWATTSTEGSTVSASYLQFQSSGAIVWKSYEVTNSSIDSSTASGTWSTSGSKLIVTLTKSGVTKADTLTYSVSASALVITAGADSPVTYAKVSSMTVPGATTTTTGSTTGTTTGSTTTTTGSTDASLVGIWAVTNTDGSTVSVSYLQFQSSGAIVWKTYDVTGSIIDSSTASGTWSTSGSKLIVKLTKSGVTKADTVTYSVSASALVITAGADSPVTYAKVSSMTVPGAATTTTGSTTGATTGSTTSTSPVLGIWYSSTSGVYMTFLSNGKAIQTEYDASGSTAEAYSDTAAWKTSGDTLYITSDGTTEGVKYSVTGTTLTVFVQSTSLTFTKVTAITAPSASGRIAPAARAVSASRSVLGALFKRN